MRRVVVVQAVAAAPSRVWRALTEPAEVAEWAGVRPLSVPADYPRPGQHARWRVRVGPLPLVLHDRVTAVAPPERLAAELVWGVVRVAEEYRLAPATDGPGSVLVSDNEVRGRLPLLGRLATRVVRVEVASSMRRLAEHCARADGHRGTREPR